MSLQENLILYLVNKKKLIRIDDLKSHTKVINGNRVLVLGCHDLNIYSNRGYSKLKSDSPKSKIRQDFSKVVEDFHPEIVLHHPYKTIWYTWSSSWKTIRKKNPSIRTYASGINYDIADKNTHCSLDKVQETTKEGDVLEIDLD